MFGIVVECVKKLEASGARNQQIVAMLMAAAIGRAQLVGRTSREEFLRACEYAWDNHPGKS